MANKPVILCADSTCDLSDELNERYQVHIYPLHVLLEDKSYQDGVDISPDEIYQTYRSKKVLPKTAAINMAEYVDFFRPWVDQGFEIVHICLGSGLSSCYRNCCLAAEELPGIYPVDSCNLSTGSGLLVIEAAERIAEGMSAAEVQADIQALVPRVSASFVIDTLEFLHKGGRCSALQRLGANMLQLKPSIVVSTEDGKMSLGKKYRGSLDKALQQYVSDQLVGRTDLKADRVFVTHSGVSEDRLAAVKQQVEATGLFREVLVTRAGCTISSHCGPNTLGVLFIHD